MGKMTSTEAFQAVSEMSAEEVRAMAARILNASNKYGKHRADNIRFTKALQVVYDQAIKGGLEQWR